jgi:uncharacterized protein YutE (UPF0331/DUF86 family)/predicted nucleotidyltransferase
VKLRNQLALVKRYFDEFCTRLSGSADNYALERLSQLVSQTLLDLSAMMVTESTGRKPGSYKKLASWLAREAGLTEQEEEFLVGLAGFRNMLVHGYAQIEPEREHSAFLEISQKMPSILDKISVHIKGDPSLSDVRKVRKALKRFGVMYAYVFGSVARKGSGRDLDLAVVFEREADLLRLGRLLEEVADTLGLADGLVDLVDLDSTDQSILKAVIDEGIVVYGGKEAAEYLEKRYIELLDLTSSQP